MSRRFLAIYVIAGLVWLLAASSAPAAPGMEPHLGPGHLPGLPQDKVESIGRIQGEYRERFFTLFQDLRAKHAELDAAMLRAEPDTARAQAAAGDISGLVRQLINLRIEVNARIAKETGVRLPMGPEGIGPHGPGGPGPVPFR